MRMMKKSEVSIDERGKNQKTDGLASPHASENYLSWSSLKECKSLP